MIRRRPALGLVVLLSLGLGLGAGCDSEKPRASTGGAVSSTTATTGGGSPTGTLTVLAAASLTEAFNELGHSFEAAHPGTTVKFSYDASSTLAAQANTGAPADLFASADQPNMKKVTDAGNATDPRVFAHNRLAILVARGNPKKITGLADFDRAGVTFVLCAVEVPCGKYGQQALQKAGVKAQPKSLETNVKAVVTKVTSGQVDAGIGYVTDAQAAAAQAGSVGIPDQYNVLAEYPMAVLKQSGNQNLAFAFLDYVLGPEAQAVLARYGFSAP
ncbi:MAG TPA: molybdate ABC transporter substrate-binding protein [Acidimicrobiia bacterium]|nr:molybdate ABC transporter substrate-binding protein [Acidimicrobiia bacterium]